ncbi:MAG: pyruvate kinase [Desulfocapsaceae bacterium]|nr:pyruvate kinase [Desulfocapsaceae bacterium]
MKILKKTKITVTLGPSSSSAEEIAALTRAGMDVARINLSHGDRPSHSELIKNIKTVRKKLKSHTAILLDTRGPEIRIGQVAEPIMLIEGRTIQLSGGAKESTAQHLNVNHPGIAKEVKAGDRILLDDGKMVLCVESVQDVVVNVRILVGGLLTSRKRVSLPGVDIGLPPVSIEDKDDILFGIEQGVDFIAASFIRKAEDVLAIRQILEQHGGTQDIIAKIENRQGVANIDEILQVSDGVMIARGDLGVEVPAEEVPIIQKKIICAANLTGKPAITATQMLESMISNPSPTRAEASDVTNAVMDGTDAVMLSGETAMGKYPVDAVKFIARCTEISEAALDYQSFLSAGLRRNRAIVADAIAYASCATAADLHAAAIVTVTSSGSTSRKVAMYRPASPVIAASSVKKSLRKLQLIRGVTPLFCKSGSSMEKQIKNGLAAALLHGLLVKGDTIVITAGLPLHTPGTTNMLRVHTIDRDAHLTSEKDSDVVYISDNENNLPISFMPGKEDYAHMKERM